jgi:toxin-antitoxin system PIN domain toxin
LSVALLDVNVLVASAWPSHVHYDLAQRWLAENAGEGWATCPITQCGFVRISSNPRLSLLTVTLRDALRFLREMTDRPDHIFWPDSVTPCAEGLVPMDRIVGHRQVTDAYLLALAAHNGGRLVTLDRGIAELIPAGSPLRGALEILRD